MSYITSEKSVHGSEPIELYEFVRGTNRYRYTSSQSDVFFISNTYVAIPISRNQLESSGELGRAGITLQVPRDLSFISEYLISPPSEVTTLTIYRKHFSAPDTDFVVIWMGRLLNLNWKDSIVELECEPVFTSIRRLGLRKQYSRACSHVLYGSKCRVNNTSYKSISPALTQAGNVITLAAAGSKADNYYSGGYAEYQYKGVSEKKMILRHIGPSLTLSGVPIGLVLGSNVSIYPGCDHTLTTCQAKFSNSLNFGGFPWIPTKNPFANLALW